MPDFVLVQFLDQTRTKLALSQFLHQFQFSVLVFAQFQDKIQFWSQFLEKALSQLSLCCRFDAKY